jgi:uncharacterized membrane protein
VSAGKQEVVTRRPRIVCVVQQIAKVEVGDPIAWSLSNQLSCCLSGAAAIAAAFAKLDVLVEKGQAFNRVVY